MNISSSTLQSTAAGPFINAALSRIILNIKKPQLRFSGGLHSEKCTMSSYLSKSCTVALLW